MAERVAERAVRITTFEAGLVAAMLNDNARGGEFFGPGQPMPTAAPEDVKGRAFDYMQAWNINYVPKRETTELGLDYPTIRYLCDPARGGLDMLRGAIETVKDKMSTQAWTVRPKDHKNAGPAAKAQAEKLALALQRPDGVHTYRQWMRLLFEDRLSIDHTFIYKAQAPKWMASPFKFCPEIIDGATIKILLAGDGRRPLPVEGAYQQILHGMVGATYTPKELLYLPYNPLPQRAYAMGPVEQFVGIVNIALRRQVSVAQYYTEGNVPDALCEVPQDWKVAQIKEFQQYFDEILAGNTAERRHMKFIPGGMHTTFTRDPKLKDEEDDFLARIICWCYGLSPNALVKSQNRAVASTQKQESAEEGLEPNKGWLKDATDAVVREIYEQPDFEFVFQDEEIQDPLTKAQVFQIALGGPTGAGKAWLTIDEVRDKTGEPPMTPEQEEELKPPPDPVPPAAPVIGPDGSPFPPAQGAPVVPGKAGAAKKPALGQKPAAKPGTPIQKLSKSSRPASRRDRPAMIKQEGKVALGVSKRLHKLAKDVVPAVVAAYGELAKASGGDAKKVVAKAVGADQFDALGDYLADQGVDTYQAGALLAAEELQKGADDAMVHLVNVKAVDWATDHAGQLIKDFADATRADLEDVVGEALEKGWSNDKLADALEDSWSFSSSRAEVIARTETAFADVQGNAALYREAGATEATWIAADADPCDECDGLDGTQVPLDGDLPPLHPNCRCDIAPVLPEEDA